MDLIYSSFERKSLPNKTGDIGLYLRKNFENDNVHIKDTNGKSLVGKLNSKHINCRFLSLNVDGKLVDVPYKNIRQFYVEICN
jgi:hypothetical protein